MSLWPVLARPTLQVRPTTRPLRFLIAEIRCRVPGTPARLSPPKSPIVSSAASKSRRWICITHPQWQAEKGEKERQCWHDFQWSDNIAKLLQFMMMARRILAITSDLASETHRWDRNNNLDLYIREKLITSTLRKISPPRWPKNLASGHLPRSKITCQVTLKYLYPDMISPQQAQHVKQQDALILFFSIWWAFLLLCSAARQCSWRRSYPH